jgi:hypothetical protein
MASYHGRNAETYLGLISVQEKVESRNIAMVYGIEVAWKDLSLKPLTKVGFRFSRERNKQRSQGLSRRRGGEGFEFFTGGRYTRSTLENLSSTAIA